MDVCSGVWEGEDWSSNLGSFFLCVLWGLVIFVVLKESSPSDHDIHLLPQIRRVNREFQQ